MNIDQCFVVKVCILGGIGVGKSSLALRFVENTFNPKLSSTIGAAFLSRKVTIDKTINYKLQIWDTAGQEKYKALVPMYYRGAAIVIVVYDITDRNSLAEGVMEWIKELRLKGPSDAVIVLVGNKLDKAKQESREVDTNEGRELASTLGALFFEASAKSGENVNAIFLKACAQLNRNKQVRLPVWSDLSFGNDTADFDPRSTERLDSKTNRYKKRAFKHNVRKDSGNTSSQRKFGNDDHVFSNKCCSHG